MIICEWKDFSTDTGTYTEEVFNTLVEDEFEAMLLEEGDTIPTYIWTVNYVVQVKKNARMYDDISFVKIQRNPVCE